MMATVSSMSTRDLMYGLYGMQQRPPYITARTTYSPFPAYNVSPNGMRDFMNSWKSGQKATREYVEFMKDAQSFYGDFYSDMSDLESSSKALRKIDYDHDKPKKIIEKVKNFAEDYNSAIDTFKENEGLGSGVRDLGIEFGETKFKSRLYAQIGLNVDNSGKISVDEDKLKQAIKDDPDRVKELLGKKGLGGQTKKKVSEALKGAGDLVSVPKSFTQPDSSSYLGRSTLGLMYPGMMYPGLMFDFFI